MKTEELGREIAKANRRMVELRRVASAESSPAWSESALAELSSALEELKVAEEELASQNEELAAAHSLAEFERVRYQELFMGAPFGQVLTDLGGVISEANRAAGDLLGLPPAILAGKPLPLFVALDERERFVRWLALLKDASHDASVCAECGGSAQFQMQAAARGREFPCEVIAAPLADRVGRIAKIRWSLRDVTERERARDAERLRDEARRKDEFLAVLGHELRNPLAAISLAAGILTASGSDPDSKRWAAEVVERHADQLRRLVDDLLDVSRVSHGKITLQIVDVDLRRVVANALESCEPILKGKAHEVTVSLPDAPVTIDGDAVRLTQVVTNLIDNAAKYTPSGGRIGVALTSGAGEVVIAVSDSGIGVEPGMLERIFGAYEQGQGTGNRGLGLGLAVVRELVALHGGSVEATSDGEGRGTTFTVVLPAAQRPVEANGKGPAASGNGNGEAVKNGGRVLVVDDNADAAGLLADELRRAGYEVELAFDGNGALAAASKTGCQIALVDLGLPDVDGFGVCRTLKAEHPSMRVVALTGYSDASSRRQAEDAGFDGFLVKPLDPRAVAAAITELIAARDQ